LLTRPTFRDVRTPTEINLLRGKRLDIRRHFRKHLLDCKKQPTNNENNDRDTAFQTVHGIASFWLKE
jgi:hypothetical protein